MEDSRSFKSEYVGSDCYIKENFVGMSALKLLNNHLSNLQNEIYWSIYIDDDEKLEALGGDHVSLDFDMEISRGVYYKPVIVAAVMGRTECLKLMLKNPDCDFDITDTKTGTNAFWLSAFYG